MLQLQLMHSRVEKEDIHTIQSQNNFKCLTNSYLHGQHSVTGHENGIESKNWGTVKRFTVLNSKRNIRPH